MPRNFTDFGNANPGDSFDRTGTLPRYAFLTDAPPLIEGGYGCHILSYNLIQSLKPYICTVITRRMRRNVSIRKIKAGIDIQIHIYPDFSILPIPGKVSCVKSRFEIALSWLWSRLMGRKIVNSGAERIFACSGADPWFLWIVESFRTATGLPVDVYLVDDFESSAILNKQGAFAKKVNTWEQRILKRVDRVFTISRGFAERLECKTGIRCRWLPVPILLKPDELEYKKPPSRSIKTIAYLGAINPLYTGAIKMLLDKIRSLNSDGKKIQLLVMTYTEPETVYRVLGRSEDFALFHNAPIEECRKRLTESDVIFLPYTFEEQHRVMVSTSFPSRLAEVIRAGRPLLVFGPEYASLPRYFIENSLDICITNPSQLDWVLKNIESYDNPETIQAYKRAVMKYHTPEAIMNILKID